MKRYYFLILLLACNFIVKAQYLHQVIPADKVLVVKSTAERLSLEYIKKSKFDLGDSKLVLSSINKTGAGYVAIYKHLFGAYEIENSFLTVILKDDFSVNTIHSELRKINVRSVPNYDSSIDFRENVLAQDASLKSITKLTPLLLEKSLQPVVRVNYASKEYPYKKNIDFNVSNRNNPLKKIVQNKLNALALPNSCNPLNCVPLTNCDNLGLAAIFPTYPPVNLMEDIPVEGCENDGTLFACCSNIQYIDADDPVLISPDGFFNYDYVTQAKDYATVFTYITIRNHAPTIFGNANVNIKFDVDGSATPTMTSDGTELILGFDSSLAFNPNGQDIFCIIEAMFAHQNWTILEDFGLFGGLLDYKTQSYMWQHNLKSSTDHICNHFGGTKIPTIPSFVTNYPIKCFENSNAANTAANNRQVLSTYLTNLANQGLNPNKVDQIVAHLLMQPNLNSAIQDGNFNEFINKFYLAAKEIHTNNPSFITTQDLCFIKNFTNSNFANCLISITINDEADYYISDSPSDIGKEPYWLSPMWESPDIWNSLSMNGPIEAPKSGQTNYIHVKVKNKNGVYDTNKKLHVYYAMASMGLSWPSDWETQFIGNQQVSGETPSSPQNIPSTITQNDPQIMIFAWNPPDPSELGITDKHHVCIYARITDASNIVKNAQCETEGSDVGNNTNRFNSIAWKNMSIIDGNGLTGGGGTEGTTVFVHNVIPDGDPEPPTVHPNADPYDITIRIEPEPVTPGTCPPGPPDPTFFEKIDLYIDLIEPLNEIWSSEGEGYRIIREGTLQVTSPRFKIKNLNLDRGKQYLLRTRFEKKKEFRPVSFALDLRNHKNKIVGGETYQIFDKGKEATERAIPKRKIELSPNPANNYLTLNLGNSGNDVKNIYIRDVKGNIIKYFPTLTKTDVYKINISDMTAGNYIIQVIFNNENIEVLKFIKN